MPACRFSQLTANNCVSYFTPGTQNHEIGFGSGLELASIGQPRYPRRIERGQTKSLL
jgi:hypothetical protein